MYFTNFPKIGGIRARKTYNSQIRKSHSIHMLSIQIDTKSLESV